MYPLTILLARILFLESKQNTFVLGISGLLVFTGFLTKELNYFNIYGAIFFLLYGIAKVGQLAIFRKYLGKLFIAITGLWLWVSLLVHILIENNHTLPSVSDYLVFVPILCEFLEIVIYLSLRCKK